MNRDQRKTHRIVRNRNGFSAPLFASTPTNRYVYASYIDEPVVRKAAGTSGTIHYYHRNQQYSITAMTTSTGAVAERYAYTAYGQPTILNASGTVLTSSAVGNRYTYTGREWDETLGLYHFRARWMSPLAGRFLGRDPLQFITTIVGKYSIDFVASKTDPSGLFGVDLKTTVVDQSCFGCGNFQSYIDTQLENARDPISDSRSSPVAFVVQKMVQIRCQRKCVSECGCYPDPKTTWTCCSWESEELIGMILSGNGRAFFVARDGFTELEKVRDNITVINPDKGNKATDGECIGKGFVFDAHDIRVYAWTPDLDAMWKRNKSFYKDTGCGYSILQMEGPALADDVQTIAKSAAVLWGSWNCCPKPKSGHCNFGGLGYRVREKQPFGKD
jgi:RHS repeat-associated protein